MSLLYTALISAALAAPADDSKSGIRVSPVIDWWVAHDQTTPFPVDNEGTMGGQGAHVETRQRVGINIDTDEVNVGVILGGLSDQVWGETWTIPGTIDERARHQKGLRLPQFRKLALTATLDQFQIETGLITSHWGLGMLANNGEKEPFFGQPEFGDRVVRARITTKPSKDSPWYFSAAWDRVLYDDLTIDPRIQWTNQALFSVLWRKGDDAFGMYGAVRRQDELLYARSTRVTVLDAYTDLNIDLTTDLKLHFGVEAAGVTGKSNRATTYNSPDRIHVLSGGAATEAMVIMLDESLAMGFAAGIASGDGDPSDDTAHDFSFDRNFGVGMILFDEVMGGIEAAQYNLLTDPDHMGQAPDAVEASVYEGAFRRASYLQPRVQYSPAPWAQLRLGMVFAWATAPITHAFYTHRNGGVPVNHLGQPTSGYALGSELDWAVQLGPFVDKDHLLHNTRVSFQGGHAVLDSNLGGDKMGRIDRYMMMFHVL